MKIETLGSHTTSTALHAMLSLLTKSSLPKKSKVLNARKKFVTACQNTVICSKFIADLLQRKFRKPISYLFIISKPFYGFPSIKGYLENTDLLIEPKGSKAKNQHSFPLFSAKMTSSFDSLKLA